MDLFILAQIIKVKVQVNSFGLIIFCAVVYCAHALVLTHITIPSDSFGEKKESSKARVEVSVYNLELILEERSKDRLCVRQ